MKNKAIFTLMCFGALVLAGCSQNQPASSATSPTSDVPTTTEVPTTDTVTTASSSDSSVTSETSSETTTGTTSDPTSSVQPTSSEEPTSSSSTGQTSETTSSSEEPTYELTLNVKTLDLDVGESFILEATLTPSVPSATFVWNVVDDSVATVDQEGMVSGVAKGETTVFVTYLDKAVAECAVTVSEPTPVLSNYVLIGGDQYELVDGTPDEAHKANYHTRDNVSAIEGEEIKFFFNNVEKPLSHGEGANGFTPSTDSNTHYNNIIENNGAFVARATKENIIYVDVALDDYVTCWMEGDLIPGPVELTYALASSMAEPAWKYQSGYPLTKKTYQDDQERVDYVSGEILLDQTEELKVVGSDDLTWASNWINDGAIQLGYASVVTSEGDDNGNLRIVVPGTYKVTYCTSAGSFGREGIFVEFVEAMPLYCLVDEVSEALDFRGLDANNNPQYYLAQPDCVSGTTLVVSLDGKSPFEGVTLNVESTSAEGFNQDGVKLTCSQDGSYELYYKLCSDGTIGVYIAKELGTKVIKLDTSKLSPAPSQEKMFAYAWKRSESLDGPVDTDGTFYKLSDGIFDVREDLNMMLVGEYKVDLPSDFKDFIWDQVSFKSADLMMNEFRPVFYFLGTGSDAGYDAEFRFDDSLLANAPVLKSGPINSELTDITVNNMNVIRSETVELALAYEYKLHITSSGTENSKFVFKDDKGFNYLDEDSFIENLDESVAFINDDLQLEFVEKGSFNVYFKLEVDGTLVSLYIENDTPVMEGIWVSVNGVPTEQLNPNDKGEYLLNVVYFSLNDQITFYDAKNNKPFIAALDTYSVSGFEDKGTYVECTAAGYYFLCLKLIEGNDQVYFGLPIYEYTRYYAVANQHEYQFESIDAGEYKANYSASLEGYPLKAGDSVDFYGVFEHKGVEVPVKLGLNIAPNGDDIGGNKQNNLKPYTIGGTDFKVLSDTEGTLYFNINQDDSYGFWLTDGPALLHGFHLLVNLHISEGFVYDKQEGEYTQYKLTMSMNKGESIAIIDTDNNNAIFYPTLDGASVGFETSSGQIVCTKSGTYDFYLKLKSGADMIYIGESK